VIVKEGRNLKVNFGSIIQRFKKFWKVYVTYSYN